MLTASFLALGAQNVITATEKDYATGLDVQFLVVKVDEAGLTRVMETMKGRDGDFENLKETTRWEGFSVPGIIGAVDITLVQGIWTVKNKAGKFTPLAKLRPLKEGEQYAYKVVAIDNEGEDLLNDPDKRESLEAYLGKLASGK